MQKTFGDGKKIAALFCAILFIFATGIAMLLVNVERRLFDASTYITTLEQLNFYDRLPSLAIETILAYPGSDDPDSLVSNLNILPVEDWGSIFQAIIPPEVIKSTSEQALISVFNYLDGKSETAPLSLIEVKRYLAGSVSTEAITAILRTKPACTLEQIFELTIGSLLGQNTSLILCNPSDDLLAFIQPLLQAPLKVIASAIPDSVDLTLISAKTKYSLDVLRVIRILMKFSLLIPLGFLFLISILVVRDLMRWLNWWGYPILLGGILGLMPAFLTGPLFPWIFRLLILPFLPDFLPSSVVDAIHEILATIFAGLNTPILLQSVTLIIIGILMILATILIKINWKSVFYARSE